MTRQFVKYNPAFLESTQLVENFVVRQTDLSVIVRTVQENTSASNQHLLVVGPRGSGKTTLVRRVAAEIERDDALCNAWYPLVFAEESYNALSAADFWLESLFHLAEQTGEQQWMESYHELRREPDEKRLAQRALGQLLDFADRIGKRILLIVENLDMLLSEFSSEDEAWSLRRTLMNEPRLMLLATATARFEQIDHPAKAMFEMFRIHDLKPLNDEECNAIWALVTGEPLPGMQIRPVRILTGGNVRLIALIARFGAKRSFRELLEDLIDLIDEHTDYFKSHLDNMAPTERKVYLALAELWNPSTAKEIAEVARLDVNTTSALLKRLASRGKVIVEEAGKRKRWYSISEGIYNIYYLMRRRGGPSARVKAAVRFMVSLYEAVSAARLVLEESCSLKPGECRDHITALAEIYRTAQSIQRIEIAKSIPSAVFDSPYLEKGIREEMIAYNTSGNGINEEIKRILNEMQTQFDTASRFYHQHNYEATIETLTHLIKQFGQRQETEILEKVATAMLNKGIALGLMNLPAEAVAAYDALIEQFGQRQEIEILEKVATAMLNKGLVLGSTNRSKDEIAAYDALIEQFGQRNETELLEKVAIAMSNKGVALRLMNQLEEAVIAYDSLIEQFGQRNETELLEKVATAMFNKGFALSSTNRPEDEIAAYDALIEQFGQRQETEILEKVATAMFNKGIALSSMNRSEEAIAAYNALIEQFGQRQETEILGKVAATMSNKGIALSSMNRPEEAIAAYNALIEQFGQRKETEILGKVAAAMSNKGIALSSMNRPEEAIAAYDALIEQFGQRQEAPVVKMNMVAKILRAKTLLKLDRHEEVLADVMAFIDHQTYIDDSILKLIVNLFVELAAYGYAEKALEILVSSETQRHVEPLVAGLRLYCGQVVRTSTEILEVAEDVVKRIEARKQELDDPRFESSSVDVNC
ncbi:pentatricopeptide repeat containing protein [Chlorobium limicola DSM 245]|uniref:Pentatricopeptide repeat containing protein n=1 Tax=Chlorobium limicola (strain DSM 245 / NBRC 103803 / 6330) TaxID=290315 RepID=B3EHL3_CHLL2|nr:tetratricopeptide repeat protein [Chlorobium limicola]ACD89793.1 pentatricopeptide repeat containing protein [Chlorobium limicola DSM 245]